MVLASLSGSITHQVAVHGAYAVFGLMAVDAVFPAASELVMLYAGAIAAGAFSTNVVLFGGHVSRGAPAYVVLASSGTVGYLVGGVVGWWIGRRGGRALVERHGRLLHLDDARFARAERWFQRWGPLGVLVGRVTPVIRSFVSIPAGVFEMRLAPYASLTLIGSAIWSFALAAAGWALGDRYARFDHGFHDVEYAVVAIVILGAAAGVLRLGRASRRERV